MREGKRMVKCVLSCKSALSSTVDLPFTFWLTLDDNITWLVLEIKTTKQS